VALFLRNEVAHGELFGSARRDGETILLTLEGDEERISLFEAALSDLLSRHENVSLKSVEHPTSGGGGFIFAF